MTEIPAEVLADRIEDVLRRVAAGEEITVLVAGLPSVELRPASSRRWVREAALDAVFAGPAPRRLRTDLDRLTGHGTSGPAQQ